jgi:hypothetical protein
MSLVASGPFILSWRTSSVEMYLPREVMDSFWGYHNIIHEDDIKGAYGSAKHFHCNKSVVRLSDVDIR